LRGSRWLLWVREIYVPRRLMPIAVFWFVSLRYW
jgi:hypothetical protein